jgi:adenine phosphoribosyltransferase
MKNDVIELLRAAVKDVPDFPKPGILFRDITPILADGVLFRKAIGAIVDDCASLGVTKVAGPDARGFLFGAPVAYALGVGFVPIRKSGKLPRATYAQNYALEYGEATLEIHRDAFDPGDRVVIVDDLLATGGTAEATVALIASAGATVLQAQFVIELADLGGRALLEPTAVKSLLVY